MSHNPTYYRRDQHDPLAVYRLTRGKYKRYPGKPVWMSELDLAIGRDVGTYQKWHREWLYWYDSQGTRLPSSGELAYQAMQQAWQQQLPAKHAETLFEQERKRAEQAEQAVKQEQRRAEEAERRVQIGEITSRKRNLLEGVLKVPVQAKRRNLKLIMAT